MNYRNGMIALNELSTKKRIRMFCIEINSIGNNLYKNNIMKIETGIK